MNLPAFELRLKRHDAKCDFSKIYMDSTPILLRPMDLSDADWASICRFICGVSPQFAVLAHEQGSLVDHEAQARLDKHLKPYDDQIFGRRNLL